MRTGWLLLLLALTACSARGPAPVTDRAGSPSAAESSARKPAASSVATAPRPVTPQIAQSSTGFHTVRRGDTLFAIAFANSVDFRQLAEWNNLESPDVIRVGQVLRLTPPETRPAENSVEVTALAADPLPQAQPLSEAPVLREPQAILLPYSDASWAQVSGTPIQLPAPQAPPAPVAVTVAPAPPSAVAPPPPSAVVEDWMWPAQGKLIGRFGAAGGKGIDIAGTRNAPVFAVAPGKVVYSGVGLRGYGRLLIIKHPGEFLSAYAHNQEMLVKEGDTVAAGQKIALMGDSDADRVKLHFEIRQYGKPLDPLKYLPERS
jgi:lipoprotein NlpD